MTVAPVGWYPTAEGGHERYWDGVTWSAPRVRALIEAAATQAVEFAQAPSPIAQQRAHQSVPQPGSVTATERLATAQYEPQPVPAPAPAPVRQDAFGWAEGLHSAAIPDEATDVEDVDHHRSGQPTHVYRDLPAYAKCPPYQLRSHDEVIWAKTAGARAVVVDRRRTPVRRAVLAWLVALWPVTATSALIYADANAWTVAAVDVLLVGLLALWYTLTLLDTALVRSRLRRLGPVRRGSNAGMAWWWVLCPPAQLLARTRAMHTSRLVAVVMVVSVLYPIAWLTPLPWLDQVFAALADWMN